MLASSVDRARSANNTVTTLRSATSRAASSRPGSTSPTTGSSTGLPQVGQYRAPAGRGAPHQGQVRSSTAEQLTGGSRGAAARRAERVDRAAGSKRGSSPASGASGSGCWVQKGQQPGERSERIRLLRSTGGEEDPEERAASVAALDPGAP